MNRHFILKDILRTNKGMKIFPTSLVIRVIQIKATSPLEEFKSKSLTMPRLGKDVKGQEISCTAGGM